MITIKKIEIKDYFGKGNFEWNLDPVVNILGGKNGSGKSSLFRLCYMLLSSDKMDENTDRHFSALFGEITLTFSNDWTLIWTHAKKGDMYITDMRGNASPQNYRADTITILDNEGQKREFSELKQLVQVFLINSFEQHASKAAQYELQPQSSPLDNPTMLDLMIKDQIDLRNKNFAHAMERFVDSPEENEAMQLEYVQNYKKIYTSLAHFLKGYEFKSAFKFTKNNQEIGYEYLSMGEKQIMLLLLMVNNTNQQQCIFLMDEPDLSMHIDWKEILVKELHELNPNMQIILSTHAPSVITGWHDKVKEVDHLIEK